MTSTQFYWRAMTEADCRKRFGIADVVHTNYPEDPRSSPSGLALYPRGCLSDQGDGLIGYVVSHPWHYAEPPALNSLPGALGQASTYYIHDIALLSAARGSGAANAVVSRLSPMPRRRASPTCLSPPSTIPLRSGDGMVSCRPRTRHSTRNCAVYDEAARLWCVSGVNACVKSLRSRLDSNRHIPTGLLI